MADKAKNTDITIEETTELEGATVNTETNSAPKAKRRWGRTALMLSLPLILIGVGAYFYLTSGQSASTENAYVQQDKVSISAEVGGRITGVYVKENQRVNKGDLLYTIDQEPFRIQIQQANAQIAAAQVQLSTLQSGLASNASAIAAARDNVRYAQQNYDRNAALMKRGFNTRANMDTANHTLVQAKQNLASAEAAAAEDRAKLSSGTETAGTNPQIAAALAQKASAELSLSRTEVRAPADGIVTQTGNLQVGQMMAQGLPALTIVISDKSWVEANFKETDLNKMLPGQRAEIEVDAYPGLKLRGHVESLGAGTGSEFSILPAQNANGNWVKVTQRVPIRIAIDEKSSRPLLAGLSAHTTVYFEDGTKTQTATR